MTSFVLADLDLDCLILPVPVQPGEQDFEDVSGFQEGEKVEKKTASFEPLGREHPEPLGRRLACFVWSSGR